MVDGEKTSLGPKCDVTIAITMIPTQSYQLATKKPFRTRVILSEPGDASLDLGCGTSLDIVADLIQLSTVIDT